MPKRTKKPEQIDEAVATDITKPPPKRAKQGELAGIEAASHPELNLLMEGIDECATAIGTARQRMGELKTQAEQKANALKLSNYRHPTAVPELVLTITEGSTKVKVVRAKSAPVEDEEASA